MIFVLMSMAVATLFYYVCMRPFSHWSKRGIPQYSLWTVWQELILGIIPSRSLLDSMQKYYNDFSGRRYAGIYQFYKPMLLLRDPGLIKQIFIKDFDHFTDHPNFIPDELDPLWQKNLFSLKGEKWRDMRTTLSPSFTASKMKLMFGLIADCARQFVEHFEKQGPQTITVEMKDVFTRFANDVIASTAFGVTCDSLENKNNEFYLMGKEITNFGGFWKNIRFIIIALAPSLAKALGISFFESGASNFLRSIVKSNIEARQKKGIIRNDMIQLLLEARKEESGRKSLIKGDENSLSPDQKLTNTKWEFNDEYITAQAFIFFFAGFESISMAMCFMAYELAVNPEVQQKLHNEVDAINTCNEHITYEVLMKMKYMDMVVSETLRKWTASVATGRVCTKDYVIKPEYSEKPVYLKKGDALFVCMAAIHRDPQYYPNPDRFDPERFNIENKDNIDPYKYLPFGLGPRSCIGNRFALMEMKLLFFYILSKFYITVVDKSTVPMKLKRSQFQLTAENGFWLGFKIRNL